VLGEPLALTVNFASGVADGPVRDRGPAVAHQPQHTALADDAAPGWRHLCTTASAVFAVRRPTWSAPELAMPAVPPADQVAVETRSPPVAWPKRYELRFVDGGWPDYRNPQESCPIRARWSGCATLPPRPLDAPVAGRHRRRVLPARVPPPPGNASRLRAR
jgi:hypothetical protein